MGPSTQEIKECAKSDLQVASMPKWGKKLNNLILLLLENQVVDLKINLRKDRAAGGCARELVPGVARIRFRTHTHTYIHTPGHSSYDFIILINVFAFCLLNTRSWPWIWARDLSEDPRPAPMDPQSSEVVDDYGQK